MSNQDDFELLKSMNKAELDSLPYDVYKWNCCVKGCNNGTTVRDYGVGPQYYFLNRNGKASEKNPKKYWQDLNDLSWFCSKHWKFFERLGPIYMFERMVDKEKPKIGDFVKKVNMGNHKIG